MRTMKGLERRGLTTTRSRVEKAFTGELPREAFGVSSACWHCRKVRGGSKVGASSTHSKRFARFGCALAALRPSHLCALPGLPSTAWLKSETRWNASLPARIARASEIVILALCVARISLFAAPNNPSLQASGPLSHEAYVWQRAWTEPVRDAITQHASAFSGLTVLNAEVSWNDQQPQLIRVPLDYSILTNAPCPIGLALRIGPCPGSVATNDATTMFLSDAAASLIAEARSHRLAPRELQIDFDCAESKLDGYHAWVEAFCRKVAPVPVSITALPSWLERPAFKRLAVAANSYVLQVHSLQRPRALDAPFTLCDPAAARRAVERAAQIGVPFRVALPTYGYLTTFDAEGRFVGLSAEGPSKTWPAGIQLREVRANPQELAQLVQLWATNQPAAMRGIIWYRLPVADDNLNWRWPTLGAIVAGRSIRESVRVETRRVEPGLVQIGLINEGELDISSRLSLRVRWHNARLVADDGLRDFELVEGRPSTVKFQTRIQPWRLPAGEKQIIGWLRLSEDREVQIEMERL
jgi:hypothetical protein